ncbi:putative glycerol-3-phosphate 2-O-acyltransferase 6-like [Capsicum annuum]|nr:putative glycerol-3-phosphate 2-O-acyltransferase 6-like [Capsicum annuum]
MDPIAIPLVQIYIDGLLEETIIQQKVFGRIPIREGGGEGHITSQTLFKRKHMEDLGRVLIASTTTSIETSDNRIMRRVVLTVVVLLDGVCGVCGHGGGGDGRRGGMGGGYWWHLLVMFAVALVGGVCGGCRWCRYSWCLWHWLVVFLVVAVGVLRKSKAERYDNNIEGGRQGSVDGDEENKSEKEEKLESEKVDDHQHEYNRSPMGRKLIPTSQHHPVKTFSIDRFHVVMPIVDPVNKLKLTSELILKYQLGKPFNYFRKIMKIENIDGLFKRCFFGRFLELPEDPSAHFQIRIVYGLLKCKIKYVGDDKDLEEGGKKMDEIWINYYGILICFGLQKFATVMGLRCDRLEEPSIAKGTPRKRSKERNKTNKRHVDTMADPMVELIKKELAGATAIRRAVRQGQPNIEAFHDQPTEAKMGASSGRVVGVGGRHAYVDTTHDDKYVDAQGKINMFENTPLTGLDAKEKRDLRWAKNAKRGTPDDPTPPFPRKNSRL